MYEVEYKVEITIEEREKLVALFERNNFTDNGTNLQNDFYVEIKDSSFGGFDFERYRIEGAKAFYTEKIWEEANGEKTRKEIEKEIPLDELINEVTKYPDCVKINKERHSLLGQYQEQEIHIDMDSVKFDHSPNMRYFIEAEILSENKEEVEKLRKLIIAFLKESLERNEIIESPGMFIMALQKK